MTRELAGTGELLILKMSQVGGVGGVTCPIDTLGVIGLVLIGTWLSGRAFAHGVIGCRINPSWCTH